MNGHELWRLRELGFGGIQVQKQESNFWSKHNCPVLQWTSKNPRHGFGGEGIPTRTILKAEFSGKNRITLPVIHRGDQHRLRPSSPSSEPPRKQLRFSTAASAHRSQSGSADLGSAASTSYSESLTSKHQPATPSGLLSSNYQKGNSYFLNSNDSMRDTCAAVFPQLAQEHHIDLGHSNKVFAARWMADDRIVMGTKCNSILVMNANRRKSLNPLARQTRIPQLYEDEDEGETAAQERRLDFARSMPCMKVLPLKGSGESPQVEPNCGIHALDVNPSGTLLASGGDNPSDVSVFRLPNFEPLTVGEAAHSDWLFDLQWLDDEYLVSGSRDSTLALWRFPNDQDDIIVCSHSNRMVKCGNGPLSGGYVGNYYNQYSTPVSYYGCFSYPSSRPVEVKKLQRFDKVRALTFNRRREALASVSLNSYLQVLDIKTFKQRLLLRMDGYTECVCLCNSPDEDLLTIGSRTSFAFFDTRTWERVGDEKLPRRSDEDPHSVQSMMPSGVRSVSWRGHMLTLGTGGGEIMFYDVRAKRFLQCDCNRSLTLKISGGWLQQDEIYQELFLNLPCPNAVYAHCYDEYGTRLFAAGGPIAATLVGNYAAMWE